MNNTLRNDFKNIFKEECSSTFFSPGRVNLIGEHTDYNGGMVFPCAITYGTFSLVSERKDSSIMLYSNNFKEVGIIQVDLHDITYKSADNWANYAKGVISLLQEQGHVLPHGLNILIDGNIPNGAGLSSSASLEVLIGTICNELFQFHISMIDIVLLSQRAENEFIGANCGIMDQFIIGMGKKDCAIALNTATLDFTYAPVTLGDASIVIMNTNKKRGLADSKYNERRSECEQALADIKQVISITSLCELNEEQFEEVKSAIHNPLHQRRAKHAIYENGRVVKAIAALENNELESFGRLMNASHVSLRDDYEVTGVELDTLVECAWKQQGTIGARMTGAGFGGCAIAIVQNAEIESFQTRVAQTYKEKIGYLPTFYIASIGDGARRLDS